MSKRSGQQYQTHLLGHHEFREIDVDKLYVDPSYQRNLNEAAMKRYVHSFDPNLFEPLTVNERKNGNGRTFALLDGQHRKVVAQKLGNKTVTCRVLHVDPDMEAALFVRLNRERIHLSPVAAFKADLAARNPACIEIQKCIETRNLHIGSTGDRQTINAVVALQKVYARGGFVRLARLLDAIILTWPEDEPHRFQGQILMGLDDFLASLFHCDVNKVAEKLSRVTPDQLLAKANKRWHGHRALGETQKSIVNCLTEAIELAYKATWRRAAA